MQPNGSLFKLSEGECNFILDLIRDKNPVLMRQTASDSYTKADFLQDIFLSEQRYDVLFAAAQEKHYFAGRTQHRNDLRCQTAGVLHGGPAVFREASALIHQTDRFQVYLEADGYFFENFRCISLYSAPALATFYQV